MINNIIGMDKGVNISFSLYANFKKILRTNIIIVFIFKNDSSSSINNDKVYLEKLGYNFFESVLVFIKVCNMSAL